MVPSEFGNLLPFLDCTATLWTQAIVFTFFCLLLDSASNFNDFNCFLVLKSDFEDKGFDFGQLMVPSRPFSNRSIPKNAINMHI